MRNNRREKGIALMLVLGAIVVLTAMAVEFAYNTNVNYHLARNALERVKAAYLAKSAYRFMQIELKFDRVFRQVVQSQNLGQYLGANANLPLCQQYPISTALVRAVFLGDEGGANLPGELKQMVSISQQGDAQEFLKFEGDFDGTCADESTKINLNAFYGLNPLQRIEEGRNNYDKLKISLMEFLGVEAYKDLFENAHIKPADAARNIGDWVDTNAEINELDAVESGPESSIYDRTGSEYPVKNGKLTTLEEAFLIDGVTDEWFGPLQKYFTVYGDQFINVCGAEESVIQNTIFRYVENNPALPPIKLNEPETMDKLVKAVMEGCSMGGIGAQIKQQIASSLDSAIGAVAGGPGEQTAADSERGSQQQNSQSGGFAAYLASEPRFFGLVLTGQVNDTVVRIKAVLDVLDPDPKRWKLLYWRIY